MDHPDLPPPDDQTIRLSMTVAQRPGFANSAFPSTMALALQARDHVEALLSNHDFRAATDEWPFEDLVFARLMPTLTPDVARYHETDGPSFVAHLSEQDAAALDRVLLRALEHELGIIELRETQQLIEALKAELEAARREQRLRSLKVSEKGAVSVYGLGYYPVTLYADQWDVVLSLADDIRTFIRENDQHLK